MNAQLLSVEALAALAARLPAPPPVQRLEAGPLAMAWVREELPQPKPELPPSAMDLLTGISIVEVGDPPPAGVAPLPPDGWRLVGRDGQVVREGRISGESHTEETSNG